MNNPSNIHGSDKMLPTVKTKWGFIDRKGNIVIEPVFDYTYPFSEGFAGVLMNGQWGFVRSDGTWLLYPAFDEICDFSEGMARFRLIMDEKKVSYAGHTVEPVFYRDAMTGIIDATGKIVFQTSGIDMGYRFSEGVNWLRDQQRKYGFIDHFGHYVIKPDFDDAKLFSDGLAGVRIDSEWKYIDRAGTQAFQLIFEQVTPFQDGLAWVRLRAKSGYIDKTGNMIIYSRLYYGDFSEGKCSFERNGQWGYMDRSGREIVAPQYAYAGSFSEGMACVKINGLYGFIDANGNRIIPPVYAYAEKFSSGLAPVLTVGDKPDRAGYINTGGEWVVPPSFSWVQRFTEDLAAVEVAL